MLCVPYVGGGSNIVKDCTYWTCGQCCVSCMGGIVIGLYVLDMWSVLCVLP